MYKKTDSNMPHSNTTWILVTNGSEAKLYSALDKDLCPTNLTHVSLNLLEAFSHPQSREKTSEVMSDNQGRYTNLGSPNSDFVSPSDPHELEKEKFSKELADMLNEKCKTNGLHSLILISPARFYGDLNKHFSESVSKLVKQVIQKDYTKESPQKLVEHLKAALALK